jgi:hypothetical protein
MQQRVAAAERFRRSYDEPRNLIRLRSRHNQHVSTGRRRRLHLRRATAAPAMLKAASAQLASHPAPSDWRECWWNRGNRMVID